MMIFHQVAKLIGAERYSFHLETKCESLVNLKRGISSLRKVNSDVVLGEMNDSQGIDLVSNSLIVHGEESNSFGFSVRLLKHPKLEAKFKFYSLGEDLYQPEEICEDNKTVLVKLSYDLNRKYSLGKSLITNSGLLSSKTIEVLEKLSLGYSRQEISALLYMTLRGVDYHIDLAKSVLCSNTISSTIYQASLFGVFSQSRKH